MALCGALLIQSLALVPLQAAPDKKPGDAQINAAVDKDLLYDSSVNSNGLDVKTTDGIVTLSGTAPNILSKERATMIAESVKGVRSVVNEIKVQPGKRADEAVQKDTDAALLGDPATGSYKIKTAVNDGTATLSGSVNSWQEKQLVASVVKGVKGVKEVKNDITINYKAKRPDTEIAADVKGALQRDIWVDDLLIKSSVEGGKVTLTGTVGSAAAKTRAYYDAYVAGATAVDDNGLNVEAWAKDPMRKASKTTYKTDEEIKKAVQDAFLFDPRVFSFNPVTSVSYGVVTLTGTVDNLKAKRAAEQDAKNTTGVYGVKNYLRVRGQNPPSDDKIAQNVKDALFRDPYVDRYEVGVTALNGVVYLTGTVDSYYEKTHAEDVASRVNGVMNVNNNLSVSYPVYTYSYWPYSYDYYEPYTYWPYGYSTWTYKTDSEIKDDIKSQLFWSPFVDSDEVNVSVRNGVATLTGTVDSWREYRDAAKNGFDGGARDVINDLKVK
ncbi:MAG: BON domain-containing protein [Chthoniobacter sp.]